MLSTESHACPSSPPVHVEALIFNVTILGDKFFKEVIKVKQDNKGGPLIQDNGVLIKIGRDTSDAGTRRKGHMKTQWKVGIYKQKREASGETTLAHTLILFC